MKARRQRPREVGRHDRRAASEERERIRRHALVPQRHQVREPALFLASQDRQGITRTEHTFPVPLERNLLTQRATKVARLATIREPEPRDRRDPGRFRRGDIVHGEPVSPQPSTDA